MSSEFIFVPGGGRIVREGKVDYPCLLRVRMDRDKAFSALQELVVHLARESEHEITLNFLGRFAGNDE